jgi:hypothetical protein
MRMLWGPQLRDFDETLAFSMNSAYYRSRPDKCAYLEGQLKRAAEREAERRPRSLGQPKGLFMDLEERKSEYGANVVRAKYGGLS